MCGRYSYTGNPNHVTTRLGIESIPSKPRYNMAPGQQAVIIRALEGERPALDKLQWGLIPFWAKDPSMGFKTINARSSGQGLSLKHRQWILLGLLDQLILQYLL